MDARRASDRGARIAEIVPRRIRSRAAEVGLTHEEIAARLKKITRDRTTRGKVGHVIRGTTPIALSELEDWAEALETTPAYLLGFTWDPTPAGPAMLGSDTPGNVKRPTRDGPLAAVIPLVRG